MRNAISVGLASAIMALSLGAQAQTTAASCDGAELRDVQGNVLVSTKDGMSTGVDKQVVVNKSRVTTTSRASVTVAFACGCDVKLKENERLDIETPATCAGLLASVTAVPASAAIGATTAVAGGLTPTSTALIGAGVGVGAYLIYRNNRNVSPN
jgi:hypothetical protein